MKSTRKFRLMTLALILAVTFAVAAFAMSRTYIGMTHGMWNQMRHGTVKESLNLMQMILYWLDFMERLQYDPEVVAYNFDASYEQEMDDFEKGRLAYHRGDFADAITLIESGIADSGPSEERLFWLGISYMREAESQNCLSHLLPGAVPVDHASSDHAVVDPAVVDPAGADPIGVDHAGMGHLHRQDFCSLPIRRFHEVQEHSRKAAAIFETLLDEYDANHQLYRWLLNVSYMTVDGFPDEVPERYRVGGNFVDYFYGEKRTEIAAKYDYLSFEDRAVELGATAYDAGRGVVIEDYNQDGFLDIVTSSSFEPVHYFESRAGQSFVDRTEEVGLGGITQTFVATAADYDNDGWVDLFFARPFDRSVLYRNQGDGTFVDVTESSGASQMGGEGEITATWVSAWGDVDNDGDLDLFVAQWAFKLPFVRGLMALPRADSILLINDGGQFVDRTTAWGLQPIVRDRYYIGAAFGDYDNDGFTDLYLSSPLRNTSKLLRNQEGRGFERVDVIGVREPAFVSSFVDVDHDGRLDIFASGFGDARTSTEQAVFSEDPENYRVGNSTLLIQQADQTFEAHNEYFRGDMPMGTMGGSFGDLDNDGCHDFYLGSGNPESWFILPNLMFIGERQGSKCLGTMENISMLHGFGSLQKGHGIAFFDFDNDGDQDVYSCLGGMWPGDGWTNQLFVNDSRLQHSWVKIRLRGRETNFYGVDARIKVTAVDASGEEVLRHYTINNGTGFGSAPYLAHIGLLDAVEIREVEVFWPVSRCTATYEARINDLNLLDEQQCFADQGS